MAVILAGALIAGGASAAAQPDLDDEPDYLVPTEAKDVVDRPLPDRFSGKATVPVAVAEALLRIEVEHPDIGVSGSEWDPEDGRVAVYATADPAVVGDILEKYGVSRSVDVRTAERSATEKAEVVRQITGDDGKLSSGHQVVSVAPSIDGSRFDVTLSEDVQLRSSVVLPQVDAEVSVQYDLTHPLSCGIMRPGRRNTRAHTCIAADHRAQVVSGWLTRRLLNLPWRPRTTAV